MPKYIIFYCMIFQQLLPAQPIAVMLDKMNVIQVGVPNPIQVVVSDIASERLVLKASQGTLKTVNKSLGQYYWRISEWSPNKAWLVLADSSFDHPIDTLFFRVNRLPEPHFMIVYPRESGYGGIIGSIDGYCSNHLSPYVIEYEVTFVPPGGKPFKIHNSGARFNPEVIDLLNRIGPGWEVSISNISWRGGYDPCVRRYEEVLTIKPE
jgi:hypothetical protein